MQFKPRMDTDDGRLLTRIARMIANFSVAPFGSCRFSEFALVFPSRSAFIRRAANHHVKANWKNFPTSSSRREEAQIERAEGRKDNSPSSVGKRAPLRLIDQKVDPTSVVPVSG